MKHSTYVRIARRRLPVVEIDGPEQQPTGISFKAPHTKATFKLLWSACTTGKKLPFQLVISTCNGTATINGDAFVKSIVKSIYDRFPTRGRGKDWIEGELLISGPLSINVKLI